MNIVYRAALTAAAFAASAVAAPPPADPLDVLCERLCGGDWLEDGQDTDVSDALVTTYSYIRDDPMGVIHGTIATRGGVAGIHEERAVVYGVNPTTGQVWTLTYGGRGNPVYGEVTLTADGYSAVLRPLGGDTSRMNTVVVFDGPDRYTQTMEITHDGGHVLGTPRTFVRAPMPPPPG